MATTLIRVIIIYVLVIFSMRLMGKRQVGELQTSELVITILLSEIAAIAVQDTGQPLINSIAAVFLLVAFEVLCSAISIKSTGFRKLISGNSLVVINDGRVDINQLKRLRFSLDDLLEALRCKDVFDISTVQYAILETNGEISVLLKPDCRTVTSGMMNIEVEDSGLQCTVIYDGKIVRDDFALCSMTEKKITDELKKRNLQLGSVMLMTADRGGNFNVVTRS